MKRKGNIKSLEVFLLNLISLILFKNTLKFSKLLVIKRNDFLELLNEYPQ